MTSLHTSDRDFENVTSVGSMEYSFDYLGDTYFVTTPENPTLSELFGTLYRATDFAAEHAARIRKELDGRFV